MAAVPRQPVQAAGFARLPRALGEPVSSVIRQRHLVHALVRRDFSAHYRGSIAGVAWAFAVPALLVAVYTLFFAGILRVKLRPDSTPLDFALFLTAANLTWTAVNQSILRSTVVIQDYRDLMKRSRFPVHILPAVVSIHAIIEQAIALTVFAAAVFILTGVASPWLLTLPLILFSQWLLTLGLAWIVSALSVYVRDVKQVINPLLLVWLFLTPVFYETSLVPPEFQGIIQANPLTPIVTNFRAVIIAGQPPDFAALTSAVVLAWAVAFAGLLVFRRLQPGFADRI